MNRRIIQFLGLALMITATLMVVAILGVVLFDLTAKGAPSISWEFLTQSPKNGMTKGGILPAIFGTTAVTLLSTFLATPLGIGCAVFLHEYAPDNLFSRLIRASIRNLAGVPSIVYGLFGVADFCRIFGHGRLGTGCRLYVGTADATFHYYHDRRSLAQCATTHPGGRTRAGRYEMGDHPEP